MKTVYYQTKVDPDVDYDSRAFDTEIAIYLADPEGWSQFFRFAKGKGKTIRLSSPETLKKEGCHDGRLSCAILNGTTIWLNADRWINGASSSKLSLEEYRQYMVTHEMGHSLGYDHVKCPGKGPAPLMMQQTLGIGACSPNTALTKVDLVGHF